jgi:DNA invertase Pin-like site-specific DNA recombinase
MARLRRLCRRLRKGGKGFRNFQSIRANLTAKPADFVLVHEISRLARKNSVVHRFVESLEECKVSLYWHAQAIETLSDNGKRNPAAGIMLALLAEMARNEAETLRERIRSGLAEARRKGISLAGRQEPGCVARIFFKGTGTFCGN